MLPAYLPRCRWFGGKARELQGIALGEVIAFAEGSALVLVQVRYASGEPELYQIPLLRLVRAEAQPLLAEHPSALIAEDDGMVLIDALFSAEFRRALWQRVTGSAAAPPESRVLSAEQSNSSLLYGETVFVKLFRRIETGINPDAEILRFLTEERKFPHVPRFIGALEWEWPVGTGDTALLAIAIAAVPNRGDAWSFTLAELKEFYQRVGSASPEKEAGIRALVGEGMLSRITQLGTRTGELHVAFAGATSNPDFAPEPLVAADLARLQQSVRQLWAEVTSSTPAADAAELAAATPLVDQRARELTTRSIAATKTRTHGDYHLGQVLETGADFVIIDFEGEPARSLAERRRKQSPVRDVAGMLRSLHYAAHAARSEDSERARLWAEAWTELTTCTFLEAWCAATTGASFRPAAEADLDFLLSAFLLEKVIYEIRYELNNRPTWLAIPLRGLQRVLAG